MSVHSTRGRRNQTGVDVQPARRRRGHIGRSGGRGVGRRGSVRVRPPEEAKEAWTITIMEDQPEVSDYGAEFVYDFNAGAGAKQMSESSFDYVDTGANIGVQEIGCTLCHETFEDQEDLLGHLHLSHAMAYSELCDCLECSGMKLSGVPFHEDKSLALAFELTQLQARAGAPTMEKDESSGEQTALDVDNDSEFQDSLTNWGLEEESPAEAVEPLEMCAQQLADSIDFNAVEAGFIGAGYDQAYFDYLDEGLSAWLNEAGAAFGVEGRAAEVVDETMELF